LGVRIVGTIDYSTSLSIMQFRIDTSHAYSARFIQKANFISTQVAIQVL
jgi:hypothetical protein